MIRVMGRAAFAFLAAACSTDVTELMVPEDLAAAGDLAGDEQELALVELGDTGSGVQAAHAWFTRYGYFENTELREAYPSWRPVVGRGPADAAVFGEELRVAVSLFQARGGLEVTGAIDEATRALMETPRCGWPDSAIVAGDEKWDDHQAFGWQDDLTLGYFINLRSTDNYGDMSAAQVRTAITNALNTWEASTNVDFFPTSDGAEDIRISFINIGSLGIGTPTALFIGNGSDWGFGAGTYHMESMALHELGHSLGFDHSSMDLPTRPVMWPSINSGEVRTAFQADDRKAIAVSPYTTWRPATGTVNEAIDIGSSAIGTAEHVWRIGSGSSISRWTGASWAAPVNGTGVRIDVAGATPWIVTSTGLARQRNAAGTGWIDRGDLDFVDIGANANGVVWAVGGAFELNNFQIFRFVGGTSWQVVEGLGRYIDVDTGNAPWITQSEGAIFHRNGVTAGNPNGTSWASYGSGARDISTGPGPDGSTWVTGPGPGFAIFQLNTQPAVAANCSLSNPSACNVEAQNRWFRTANGGRAIGISVGLNALPWVVGDDKSVWRRRP